MGGWLWPAAVAHVNSFALALPWTSGRSPSVRAVLEVVTGAALSGLSYRPDYTSWLCRGCIVYVSHLAVAYHVTLTLPLATHKLIENRNRSTNMNPDIVKEAMAMKRKIVKPQWQGERPGAERP